MKEDDIQYPEEPSADDLKEVEEEFEDELSELEPEPDADEMAEDDGE